MYNSSLTLKKSIDLKEAAGYRSVPIGVTINEKISLWQWMLMRN